MTNKINSTITNSNRLTFKIPWKCWFGNELLDISFPNNWAVRIINMSDAISLDDSTIKQKILNPVSSLRLKKLAKGKKRPVIIIDDLSRPTESYRILPILIKEMLDAGIKLTQIDILVSLGAHRPMSRSELIKKVGEEIVNTTKIYNHNPYENLKFIGKTSIGTPLYLNRFLTESDLKIVIGSVTPHPYAGFGGGAKLILPGLAGIDTIEQNHKPAYSNISGKIGHVKDNDRRAEIENAAEMVGIDFAVNTICNSKGKTAGIYAGNLSASYSAAIAFAQKVYSTRVQYNLDVGVFNAFPKDNGIIQSFNALNIWSTRDKNKQVVKPGGTIVICSSCPDGVGYHGLSDKGMRLYVMRNKHGSFKDILSNRKIIIFSPTLLSRDIHDFLPKSVLHFKKWSQVIEELNKTYKSTIEVGVFPCSPLQIDMNVL